MRGDPWTSLCQQLRYLRTLEPHPTHGHLLRGLYFVDGRWCRLHVRW